MNQSPFNRLLHYNTTQPSSNYVKNSKYTPLTFLPLVLFQQFRQFINLFYLALAISQFIPQLKVGFLIDYLGPLLLVLTLSLLKELYDDYQRHKRDRAINNYTYEVVGEGRPVPS